VLVDNIDNAKSRLSIIAADLILIFHASNVK
jgi:hypothetical protein